MHANIDGEMVAVDTKFMQSKWSLITENVDILKDEATETEKKFTHSVQQRSV